MEQQLYLLGADAVLAVHFAFVVFVVIGLVAIWIGGLRRWRFARNFWFRLAHLLAMACVAGESVSGMVCPLTIWEDKLRLLAGEGHTYAGSWMQRWVHKLMFFELSETTFTILYIVFLLVVLGTLWFVPPRWPWRSKPAR